MEGNSHARIPQSIGVVIDGNRRWAKEHGLPVLEGHRAGAEKIKEMLVWAHDAGVKEVIIYVFSSENWKRAAEEVAHLMGLIEYALSQGFEEIIERDVRIRIIGERDQLPQSIQKKISEMEDRTKEAKNGTVALALSYGGRSEILTAVNQLLFQGREQVTEEELRDAMWSAGLLDPDLIIRTGGEKRLSNFLPWQSVYSELFFIDTKWPAFSKEEFLMILDEYGKRERRVGR